MSWISRVFGDFQILEGETHAEELTAESLDADEVNNTYRVDENDELQAVADDLKADHGGGKLSLMNGVHLVNNTVISGAITVTAHNTGSNVEIRPDGDVDGLILESQNPGENPRVRDLTLSAYEQASAGGYTSDLLTLRAPVRYKDPFAENVNLVSAPQQGTGIFLDASAEGITYQETRSVEIEGFDVGLQVGRGGNFISANRFDLTTSVCREIIAEGSNAFDNEYILRAQFEAAPNATERVIDMNDYAHLDLTIWDTGNASSPADGALIKVDGPSVDEENMPRIEINRPIQDTVKRIMTTRPQYTRIDGLDHFTWMGGSNLPRWLTSSGTGSFTPGSAKWSISTGSTSGDTFTVGNGGGNFEPRTLLMMEWRQEETSTTQVVHRSGFSDPDSSFFAGFVADPADSLATGITTNLIYRVVEADGTVVTNTDTGIALGGPRDLAIGIYSDGNRCYGASEGSFVNATGNAIAQNMFGLTPIFEVETTAAASKTMDLWQQVDLKVGRL